MKKYNLIIILSIIIILISSIFQSCELFAPPVEFDEENDPNSSNDSTSSNNSSIFLNEWTNLNTLGSKPSARRNHTMCYSNDNKIILFGGYSINNETWRYDITTNTWANINPSLPIPSARSSHTLVYADNNKIILFGGWQGGRNRNNEIWEYNIKKSTWANLNPPDPKPSARNDHAMVYIGNNKIILFGGDDGTASYNNETWEYNITTNTWTNLSPSLPIPSSRYLHRMVYTNNNKMILYGGVDSIGRNDETWEYNITTNIWTNLNPSLPNPGTRYRHTMSYIGNNKIILFGGRDGVYNNETWEYDIITNIWTYLNPPDPKPSPRESHDMCFDGNKIILFGGYNGITNFDETWQYKY